MAGKKKESATVPQKWEDIPEIPKEEQPYPLPEGWKWVLLKDIALKIVDGSHNPPQDSKIGIPLLSATNIKNRLIEIEQATRWITKEEWEIENKRTQIEIGDILLTIVGTLGRVAIVNGSRFALQRSVAVIRTTQNHKYLSYFFETPYIQEFINNHAKGTAQKGFYLKQLEYLPCAIAPFETQQRIVNRIESLFSKLDEAAEKVQALINSHEVRKQAILHKAFSGELTRDVEIEEDDSYKDIPEIPKEEQPYPLPEGWKWVKGKTIFCKGSNISPSGEFFEYIDIDSIDNSKQKIKASKILSVKDAPSRAKRNLKTGDTIFSMVRPYLKNIAYIDENFSRCIASTGFYVCRPNEYINSKYLFLLMTSDYVVNGLNKFMRGDNSPSIKPEHIENFVFPLPPKQFQYAIVNFIDRTLYKMDKIKDYFELISEKIKIIKNFILKISFYGRL